MPVNARAGPSPTDCERIPTAWRPATLPTAAATDPVASAVARARVGKSSPDHAPSTGVAALANELHSTLPITNPGVPVAKLTLAATAVAPVSAAPGALRPKRSLR